ncbi:hypothetical protein ACJMK2_034416 [Sinanodonta woodiana]|uniref:Alpha-mannosidase n=1 Tax=Sinanodonta woodiana TaxID=1069815 RepID=A0ABD3WS17_SINWO
MSTAEDIKGGLPFQSSPVKMFRICAFVAAFSIIFVSARPGIHSKDAACGYASCNPVKDGMINIHLVPHTHDDVGWLKTVDQYFYGSRNDIQNAGVQYILDSVIPELMSDPSKRFIYVEIAFFARWWRELSDSMRHVVKGLVNNGQLEFILGGWCMNDEASTHYNSIIDQQSLGFEFLRQNFGDCGRPRIGWQIDPFGHSRELASLFAQFGFDGYFFGRLDYQDKATREKNATMEMLWEASPKNLGQAAELFTGVLPNGYGPPDGFCFDQFCNDDPIMDDDRLHDYNKDDKVKHFISAVNDQAKHFTTNHLIMTMGSDFQYQNAPHWYKNMDKLIQYVNELQVTNNSTINVLYSTPSCYTYYVNKAGKKYTTKSDDFFPYASQPHEFWTGYFTSRAALKGYERKTNNFLQVCKQMDALTMLTDADNSTYNIQILREAMGVVQHHDGVSGTEKQHVAYDYAERLAYGTTECEKVVNDAYQKLLPKGSVAAPAQNFCNLLNISMCDFTENNKQFAVIVYNPVGRTVRRHLRIPVVGTSYVVMDSTGQVIQSQLLEVSVETKKIPERSGSKADHELVFAVKIPALGFNTYFIMSGSQDGKGLSYLSKKRLLKPGRDIILKNQHLSLKFNGNTGRLENMKNLRKNQDINVTSEFLFYYSFPGNNSKDIFQASGAYVFRPNDSQAHSFGPGEAYFIKGPVVSELHTYFGNTAVQVIRVYADSDAPYFESEWTVGPIDITDNYGKEVIARYNTKLKTDKTFYTDANGREILKRVLDYRETWPFNQTEIVAGNYYPVNSRIYIQDVTQNVQLTVLTDRSEGGSSLSDGSLELMVHRRVLNDDSLGVGEPLNETGADGKGLIVRGKHHVILDSIAGSARIHRDMALQGYMSPVVSFASVDYTLEEWNNNFNTMWSGLKQELPANVHMLTLEQWGGPAFPPSSSQPYLIRLEHIYENGEDPDLSKPAIVSLSNLFVPFTIESVVELTLGANLQLSQLNRLKWNKAEEQEKNSFKWHAKHRVSPNHAAKDTVLKFEQDPLIITLNPMQIRTFQVNLADGHPASTKNKFSVFS